MSAYKNIISITYNESDYEITYFSFKSDTQLPTFMVIKEFRTYAHTVYYADVLFSID